MFFYLSATEEDGKEFADFPPHCCPVTEVLMLKSHVQLQVPELCGEVGWMSKGEDTEAKKVFRFQDHALPQELPSPTGPVTRTIMALPRAEQQLPTQNTS